MRKERGWIIGLTIGIGISLGYSSQGYAANYDNEVFKLNQKIDSIQKQIGDYSKNKKNVEQDKQEIQQEIERIQKMMKETENRIREKEKEINDVRVALWNTYKDIYQD